MDKTAFSILARSDYRAWFFGQLAYHIGSKAQGLAISWLAYALTGSVSILGIVAALTLLPHLVLGPVGGWLADRFDERRLVLLTQSAAATLALLLAALEAEGQLTESLLLPFALLVGMVNGLDAGPRPALMQRIVGERALMPKAVALNSLAFHVSRFAGPGMAGLMLAAADAWLCFLVNGLLSLPLIFILLRMRPEREAREHQPGLLRGFRYAARHDETRTLLLGLLAIGLLASPYIQLLPWFAKEVFGGNASHYGLLFAATALGSLSASLWIALTGPAQNPARLALRSFSFGALCILVFAETQALWLAVGLLVMAGFCFTHGAVALNTRIQLTVPVEVRGRVLALVSMAALGAMPLGSLAIAFAAERFGTQASVAACALSAALLTYWLRRRMPV